MSILETQEKLLHKIYERARVSKMTREFLILQVALEIGTNLDSAGKLVGFYEEKKLLRVEHV